jgi:hypothetical protein
MHDLVRIAARDLHCTSEHHFKHVLAESEFPATGVVPNRYDSRVFMNPPKPEFRVIQIMRAASRWQKTIDAHNFHSMQA